MYVGINTPDEITISQVRQTVWS